MFKKSLLIIISLFAGSAMAGTETWDFGTADAALDSWGMGNSITMNVGGVELVISGWSDTGGSSDNRFETGQLMKYGNGIGMINRDEGDNDPNHSVDSRYSNDYDFLLLEFDTAVRLDEFGLSWRMDGDMSVASYNGDFAGFDSSSTWANLISSGWETTGNYNNVGTSSYQATGASAYSKTWLISTFNAAFGTPDGGLDLGDDGFKLKGLVTTSPQLTQVSEPAALLIFSLGLVMLFGRARRR